MAEDLQGSFCGSSLWSSSIRCGDMLSCSMAVGDIEGSFGLFPSTAEIVDHLSNEGTLSFQDYYKPLVSEQVIIADLPAMDFQPDQLLGFDLSPSLDDWSQSFLTESSETCSFQYAAVIGGEEHASTPLMGYRSETSHDDAQMLSTPISFSSTVDHQTLFDPGDAAGAHLCPSSIEQDQTPKPPNASPLTDLQQDFKNTSLFLNALENNNGRSFTPGFMINSDATEKPNSKASRDCMLPRAKKLRIETPSTLPTFKVRKEKLGDRITALQQLVSPFGKTDTASVLHEAVEYIKFLHEQVGALSNPYLRNNGHQRNHQHKELQASGSERINGECTKKELRSRGLCLVPFTSMLMVPNEIPPVDFWAQLWRKSYR